jgi:hypothetical protein
VSDLVYAVLPPELPSDPQVLREALADLLYPYGAFVRRRRSERVAPEALRRFGERLVREGLLGPAFTPDDAAPYAGDWYAADAVEVAPDGGLVVRLSDNPVSRFTHYSPDDAEAATALPVYDLGAMTIIPLAETARAYAARRRGIDLAEMRVPDAIVDGLDWTAGSEYAHAAPIGEGGLVAREGWAREARELIAGADGEAIIVAVALIP